jgi:hypothetical protein
MVRHEKESSMNDMPVMDEAYFKQLVEDLGGQGFA